MMDWSRHQQLIDNMLDRTLPGGKPQSLYEPVRYILQLGGKRLRPMLTLLACEAMGEDVNKAVMPAIGLELFHNFTLIHDDIMDEAPLRRGKETVHKKWNVAAAILSGDVMLIKAYELLMHSDGLERIRILELFNKTATLVCEGQQMDMDFSVSRTVSTEEYLAMIERKTAVLLGCALKTGAIIARADTQDADLLYDFGINMGIGFQLMDDILDVFGDEQKLGKQSGGDILEDKKTWLWIKAFELADPGQRKILTGWLGKKEDDQGRKLKEVKQIFLDLDIHTLAMDLAEFYFSRADRLLANVMVPVEQKEGLKSFASYLKSRVS